MFINKMLGFRHWNTHLHWQKISNDAEHPWLILIVLQVNYLQLVNILHGKVAPMIVRRKINQKKSNNATFTIINNCWRMRTVQEKPAKNTAV